jgi:RimJ/RimL family protein N-acetyltransferase
MEIGRIYDPAIVQLVVKELWDVLSDDSDIQPEDYEPRFDNDSRWYVSVEDDDVIGVYWLRRINHITWEAHTNIRKKYWGTGKAIPHATKVLELMFEDSGAEKIIAVIPEPYTQVTEFVEKLGFTQEGRRTQSFRKNGETYDELYYGKHRTI